jgi:hypothetical protein
VKASTTAWASGFTTPTLSWVVMPSPPWLGVNGQVSAPWGEARWRLAAIVGWET